MTTQTHRSRELVQGAHCPGDRLDRCIDSLPGVSLEEMNSGAALMTRTDRKYFVPRDVLADLLDQRQGARVLEIDGVRRHGYTSTYFDTPGLLFFRQHLQGRRIRNKVRTRTYSSGASFLEVKGKAARGETVKERIAIEATEELDDRARQFIDSQLPEPASGALAPVLHSRYRRVTVLDGANRITCDFDLEFDAVRPPYTAAICSPLEVLVETKTAAGRGEADRYLASRGIRPVSVSKYGVGVCLTQHDVPANRWHRVLGRYFNYAPERTRLNVHSLLRRKETGVTAAMVSN